MPNAPNVLTWHGVAVTLNAIGLQKALSLRVRAVMLHRFTTCLLLACYSAIALGGQGLHWVLGDDSCCTAAVETQAESGASKAVASKSTCQHRHVCNHSHGHSHRGAVAAKSKPVTTKSADANRLAVRSHRDGSQHDCDHCTICQHQSLGQLVASDSVELCGLLGCDEFRPTYRLPLALAAAHSLSQPRAPPAA